MNVALVFLMLVVVSGIAWVLDKSVFLPRRRRTAQRITSEMEVLQQGAKASNASAETVKKAAKLREAVLSRPWWLEYTAGFFPIILTVFLLRSFLVEPFKIPSGSMLPTLVVGDFILVNKFIYGIRLPVSNTKIIDIGQAQRGDVVVFRYPKDPSIDYIKRIIGVPGDTVSYIDRQLAVNGTPVSMVPLPDYFDEEHDLYFKRYQETLGARKNDILNSFSPSALVLGADNFRFRENCAYGDQGLICTVPPGHYFVMGDNRDNSADSRVWGFVPDQNLVGRAFFIWFNFKNLKRIGRFE